MSDDIIPFSADTRNAWEYPDAFSAWVRRKIGIFGKQDADAVILQATIAVASSVGQIGCELTQGFIDDSGEWDPDGNEDIIRVSAGGVFFGIISICQTLGYNPFTALTNHFDTYMKRENMFPRPYFDAHRLDRSFWADVHGMYTSASGHLLSIATAVQCEHSEGRGIKVQGVAEVALRGCSDLAQVLGYFGIGIASCIEKIVKEEYGNHEPGTEDDDGQG
jgi:hypothetical protein